MAQPSVINYFNTRKRAAVNEAKSASARKVLVLDKSSSNGTEAQKVFIIKAEPNALTGNSKTLDEHAKKQRKVATRGKNRLKTQDGQKNIEQFLRIITKSSEISQANSKSDNNNIADLEKNTIDSLEDMQTKVKTASDEETLNKFKSKLKNSKHLEELKRSVNQYKESEQLLRKTLEKTAKINLPLQEKERDKTSTKNAMDKISTNTEQTLTDIKKKLTRSERLAELKASLTRFKESEKKLKQLEEKSSNVEESPTIKSFKSIELEVQLSPQKVHSPQKLYLSPKKDTSVRRNILNFSSPTKNAVELSFSPHKLAYETEQKSLHLPFKFKTLLEIFRSVDTVSQIMFNRKETITFRKLKAAVEKLLKRNFLEKHLGQIKQIYPDSYIFKQEKLREFGTGIHQEKWELVLYPAVSVDHITAETLMERRRHLQQLLLDKTKDYHDEFLKTLDIKVPREKLTRWHPEFDIERVPDIDSVDLPKGPIEEALHSGKEVLEKARSLFHCNTRMEAALERLEQNKEASSQEIVPQSNPISMKGIPKALLEKVRQRQAAKMLQNMTRSDTKELEIQIYSRLPELARLTRNLFVAEKKSVLPMDLVTDKLNNSFRTFLTKTELENHLRIISKEVPGWLVFHEIRNGTYIKVSKNADLNVVLNKLENVLREKDKL